MCVSHVDQKTGTPAAALSSVWSYWVNVGTGLTGSLLGLVLLGQCWDWSYWVNVRTGLTGSVLGLVLLGQCWDCPY